MQIRINEEMYGKSEYSDYMLYLFQATSTEVYPDTINCPNEAWFDYIDLLYKYSGQPAPTKIITDDLPHIHIDNPSRGIMLAYSGGSDSTTHAAYLNDRDDVDSVVLFHLRKINRAYPNESLVSQVVADYLGLELLTLDMKYSGKMEHIESPVKNHLILAYMIPEMIERNMVRCSEGVFPNETLDTMGGVDGLSDAYDFFKAFEKAVQKTFPQYRFIMCFKNQIHEFAYLMKYHKDLIPLYQSCLLPDIYRNKIRSINEPKYNIKLLPNRCLSCWKCCREYILMGMFRYHKIDPVIYGKQCLPVLRKYYARDKGITVAQANKLSVEVILSNFISFADVQRYVTDMSLVDADFSEVAQYNYTDCWSDL